MRSCTLPRLAVAVLAAFVALVAAGPAAALCAAQPENGEWVNVDSNTRSITRITLRFVCQDQIRNGRPYPPGPPWYMHLWGSCSPTDCDWGEIGARRLDSGWVYGFYDQGFARRQVFARTVGADRLRLYIRTDFTDPGRSDYNSDLYFRRR